MAPETPALILPETEATLTGTETEATLLTETEIEAIPVVHMETETKIEVILAAPMQTEEIDMPTETATEAPIVIETEREAPMPTATSTETEMHMTGTETETETEIEMQMTGTEAMGEIAMNEEEEAAMTALGPDRLSTMRSKKTDPPPPVKGTSLTEEDMTPFGCSNEVKSCHFFCSVTFFVCMDLTLDHIRRHTRRPAFAIHEVYQSFLEKINFFPFHSWGTNW
jgi:hypothetical protein